MNRKLLALAFAAALPFSAQAADGLSYTWVEADYVNLDQGVDGIGLRGSVDLGNSGVYLTGGHARLEADAAPGDIDVRASEVGVGYHHSLSAKTDLLGEVAYRNARSDDFNIDGARASIGMRSAIGERLEGFVKGNYYDASDYRGDATGTVGGQFKLNKTWGATAEAEIGNGDEAYLIGVRASF